MCGNWMDKKSKYGRYLFCKNARGFVPIEDYRESSRVTTTIITDSMDETWHPCDGKYYTSKSGFRETTKAHGGIEIGNENPHSNQQETHDPSIKQEIIRQYYGH